MVDPREVAFGRLAIERGLVAREQLQRLGAELSPGASLVEALVQRQLLRPDQVQRLWSELSGVGPATGAADATATAASSSGLGSLAASGSSGGGLPAVGERIAGRYEVCSILGKGGMGAVYRARDLQLKVEVAVKVLLPGVDAAGTALERFEREAQGMSKVGRHGGIVRIHDAGLHAGALPYAVLDLVEGRDLRSRVKDEGPLPIDEAVRLTEQVARAIQHCHEQGILHRDLKPANVLVRAEDGLPFLTDFGLVRDAEAERLTKTGQLLGTPAYMSPEQADGDWAAMDARTDVYGLGAVLYELLCGVPPFQGDGMQVLKRVLLDPPKPPKERRAEIPDDLDAICRKALAKARHARYPSAEALADDLAAFRSGDPLTVRPPGRWEDLKWRGRRGDPRAVTLLGTLVLAPILFAIGASTAVYYRLRRAREIERVTQLRDHVDAIAAGLPAQDPLLLELKDALAARKQLLETIARAAPLRAGPTPEAHAQFSASDLDLLDGWISSGPVADALGTKRIQALERVMRRVAVNAGWPAPWMRIGEEPSPEDHLFVGLKLLGWGRDGVAVSASQLALARSELQTAGQGPSAVATASATVLDQLSRLRTAVRDYLEAGADARGVWSTGVWKERTLEKLREPFEEPPGLLASTAAGQTEPAGLLATIARPEAEAAVRRLAERLPAKGWKGPTRFQRVRDWFQKRVTPLVGRPTKKDAAITALAMALVRRAQDARTDGRGLVPLIALFDALRAGIDWSWDDFQREIFSMAVVHLSETLARHGQLEPSVLELMPRLGFVSDRGNLRPLVLRTLPSLEEHARKVHRGDAWLLVATARDEVEKASKTTLQQLIGLFARALGSHLSPTEREGFGLQPVELEREMTPSWEPYVHFRIAALVLKLQQAKLERVTDRADPRCVRAATDVLLRLWREKQTMPRSSYRLSFLRTACHALGIACELGVDHAAQVHEVRRVMIAEAARMALNQLQLALNGKKNARATMATLDHTIDADKNEYDWLKVVEEQLEVCWPDDVATARKIYAGAQARLRALRGYTSFDLEWEYLKAIAIYGDDHDRGVVLKHAAAIQSEAVKGIESGSGPKQGLTPRERREVGAVLQAQAALGAGDLDRVLAIYRSVLGWKPAPGYVPGAFGAWATDVLPRACVRLIEAKRRADAVWLFERVDPKIRMRKPVWLPIRAALRR